MNFDLLEDERGKKRSNSIGDNFQKVLEEIKLLKEENKIDEVLKEENKSDLKADKTLEPDSRNEKAKVFSREDEIREISSALYQNTNSLYLPNEKANLSDKTLLAAAVALSKGTEGKLNFSEEALEAARHTKKSTLMKTVESVVKTYTEERGAQYDMSKQALFQNFPQSVIDMNDFELYTKQYISYLASYFDEALETDHRLSLELDGPKKERPSLKEEKSPELLKPGDDRTYDTFIKNLIGGKNNLSPKERDIVEKSFDIRKAEDIMPEKIPMKDTLAYVAKLSMDRDIPVDKLPLKNATDALRVGKELSATKDDYSRNPNNGYYKFTNREKKFIYEIIEKDSNARCNMQKDKAAFKALARGLNGFKNAETRYPKAYEALNAIRTNSKNIVTLDGKYDKLVLEGQIEKAAEMRKEFPGKFNKELDNLLSKSKDSRQAEAVIRNFEEVADKIPTRSLFITKNHFENRTSGLQIKTVIPKGKDSECHAYIKDQLPIPEEREKKIIDVVDKALDKQLKEREPMGKVYIDPRYKNIPIPKNTEMESRGMRPITRGTRIDIPKDANVIRSFVHWKGEDLDLSASLLGKDLSYYSHVSYTNLKDGWAVHSGDVTYAPEGGSEFIDLKLSTLEKMAKEKNVGYVAFSVNVFRGDVFQKTDECMFGFMIRDDMNSGEIYEPRTVESAFDLNSNSKISVTMLYDIENRQMIWADLNTHIDRIEGLPNAGLVNIENSINNVTACTYSVLNQESPSMYDVLVKNAENRGAVVEDPKDADVVFGIERDSQDTRKNYGIDNVEIENKDGLKDIKKFEYHDMFERASWKDYL